MAISENQEIREEPISHPLPIPPTNYNSRPSIITPKTYRVPPHLYLTPPAVPFLPIPKAPRTREQQISYPLSIPPTSYNSRPRPPITRPINSISPTTELNPISHNSQAPHSPIIQPIKIRETPISFNSRLSHSPITRPINMVTEPRPRSGCWAPTRWCGSFVRRMAKAIKGAQKEVKDDYAPERCVGRTRGLAWATKTTRGKRSRMEDFHTSVRGVASIRCDEFGGCAAPNSACSQVAEQVHCYSAFDGHRGQEVSEFCANLLHHIAIHEWKKLTSEEVVDWRDKWSIAFSSAFAIADEAVKDRRFASPTTGTTATAVVLSLCQIITANCGNSRAILCRSQDVVLLTRDHKAEVKSEANRIKQSGGHIYNHEGLRVEGVLTLTRAIGDHDLKQFVISTPDVSFTQRSDDDECLIIATDGLWDVMSTEMVAKIARNKLLEYRSCPYSSSSKPAALLSEALVNMALTRKSADNISIIVVDLRPLHLMKIGMAGTTEAGPYVP